MVLSVHARAGEAWRTWFDEPAFRALANELSSHVDLFQAVWEVDPSAEFYGGTSRDFLWFLRAQLSTATSPEDLARRIGALRKRPIQIKEFVVGQSDVDIITDQYLDNIPFDPDLLTRLESISPTWFTPGHQNFEQESLQGRVPVEKIRLGKGGFEKSGGDGVGEIYRARPTLEYDPRIVDTDYYHARTNHPILLALRYLRQVAVAYYRQYGTQYPNDYALFELIDLKSRAQLERILGELRATPETLNPFLRNTLFIKRINKALHKLFRSYTNPTAAKVLLEHFNVDALLGIYGDKIEPYHTLMYHRFKSAADAAVHADQLTTKHFVQRADSYYTAQGLEKNGGTLSMFHGTGTVAQYRSIVFQGNIASEGGHAGPGVYAVDPRSRDFAAHWRGEHSYVVELQIRPDAQLVDITEGAGLAAYQEFQVRFENLKWFFDGVPAIAPARADESAFARFVDADILRYPYKAARAYVIKNGAAIAGQVGVTVPLMTVPEARTYLARHNFSLEKFGELVAVDPGFLPYADFLLDGAKASEAALYIAQLPDSDTKLQMQSLIRLYNGQIFPSVDTNWRAAFRHLAGLQRAKRAYVEPFQFPEPFLKDYYETSLEGQSLSRKEMTALSDYLKTLPEWSPLLWEIALRVGREHWSKLIAPRPLPPEIRDALTPFRRSQIAGGFILSNPTVPPDEICAKLGVSEAQTELSGSYYQSGHDPHAPFNARLFENARAYFGIGLEDIAGLEAPISALRLTELYNERPDLAQPETWREIFKPVVDELIFRLKTSPSFLPTYLNVPPAFNPDGSKLKLFSNLRTDDPEGQAAWRHFFERQPTLSDIWWRALPALMKRDTATAEVLRTALLAWPKWPPETFVAWQLLPLSLPERVRGLVASGRWDDLPTYSAPLVRLVREASGAPDADGRVTAGLAFPTKISREPRDAVLAFVAEDPFKREVLLRTALARLPRWTGEDWNIALQNMRENFAQILQRGIFETGEKRAFRALQAARLFEAAGHADSVDAAAQKIFGVTAEEIAALAPLAQAAATHRELPAGQSVDLDLVLRLPVASALIILGGIQRENPKAIDDRIWARLLRALQAEFYSALEQQRRHADYRVGDFGPPLRAYLSVPPHLRRLSAQEFIPRDPALQLALMSEFPWGSGGSDWSEEGTLAFENVGPAARERGAQRASQHKWRVKSWSEAFWRSASAGTDKAARSFRQMLPDFPAARCPDAIKRLGD